MAENFLVIFDQAHGGAGGNIIYKNQAEATSAGGAYETAKVATVSAGTAQEAATAVKKAFGEAQITGKVRVAKSSNVEEKNA